MLFPRTESNPCFQVSIYCEGAIALTAFARAMIAFLIVVDGGAESDCNRRTRISIFDLQRVRREDFECSFRMCELGNGCQTAVFDLIFLLALWRHSG